MNELEKLEFLLNTPVETLKRFNFDLWKVNPDNSSGMKGFTGEPELAIGSVQGYRWWKMYLHKQEALTGAYGGTWTPGKDVYEAGCSATRFSVGGSHTVPDPNCGCGYWCYWKPDSVESVMGADKVGAFFQGVVEGFGVVLIGDKGFRCAKAKLKGLALDTDNLRKQMNESRNSRMVRTPWGKVDFQTEGAAETHAAITGRTYRDNTPVPEDLITAAAAEIENNLEELYPQAKVFSSLSTMHTYFGLDKNYGYASSRNAALMTLGKEGLNDALIKLAVVYCSLDDLHAHRYMYSGYSGAMTEIKRMRGLLQEILSEI